MVVAMLSSSLLSSLMSQILLRWDKYLFAKHPTTHQMIKILILEVILLQKPSFSIKALVCNERSP